MEPEFRLELDDFGNLPGVPSWSPTLEVLDRARAPAGFAATDDSEILAFVCDAAVWAWESSQPVQRAVVLRRRRFTTESALQLFVMHVALSPKQSLVVWSPTRVLSRILRSTFHAERFWDRNWNRAL